MLGRLEMASAAVVGAALKLGIYLSLRICVAPGAVVSTLLDCRISISFSEQNVQSARLASPLSAAKKEPKGIKRDSHEVLHLHPCFFPTTVPSLA